jgi:Zn-dependent alcohol dehydrogenase
MCVRATSRPSSVMGRSACAVSARRLGAEQIIMLGRHGDRIALAREFGATDVVSERGDAAIVHELPGSVWLTCQLGRVPRALMIARTSR